MAERDFYQFILKCEVIPHIVTAGQRGGIHPSTNKGQTRRGKIPFFGYTHIKARYRTDFLVAPEPFLAELAKEIENVGYHVMGATEASVFKSEDSKKGEMRLGGTINHLNCKADRTYQHIENCDVATMWELYDTRKGAVVFKVLTRFRREMSFHKDHLNKEVKNLLAGPLMSLLSRDRFVAHMKINGVPTTSDTPLYSHGSFKKCPSRALSLPKNIAETRQASGKSEVKDVEDPPFKSLPLEPTDAVKEFNITFKDRHLYSGYRYPLLFGAPLMAIAGYQMIRGSNSDYKEAEDDYKKRAPEKSS